GFLKLTPTSRTAAMTGAVSAVTLKARRPSATNRRRLLGRFASAASAPLATTMANATVSRPLNLGDIKFSPSVSTIAAAFENASPSRRSFDHLVGERKKRWRNGEAERLRGPQIDDQLELGRLFDRQVSGLFTPENPVHVDCRAFRQGVKVGSVGHEPTGVRKEPVCIDGRQLQAEGKLGNACRFNAHERPGQDNEALRPHLGDRLECLR